MFSTTLFLCLALTLTNGVLTDTVEATDQAAQSDCLEMANQPPMPGRYIPQCDEDGNYTPRQCHASTGYCWCVDPMGKKIHGTQSQPGTTPTDCENLAPKNCSELASRPHIPGRYIPQCDEDGNYKPKQCHGSTGYCWCVDPMGKEIEGTQSPPGTTPTDCENLAPQKCLDLASQTPIPGKHIPQCDEDGNYKSTQCHGSTGHCWCVDHNGKELEGTRWQAGTTPTNCEKPAPKNCSELASRPPIPGRYIPQCDEDGNYTPRQCHGSTGYCWCVDPMGNEIKGTKSPPGTTPTDCENLAPKNCSELASRPPMPGRYIPQCDEDGNYTPRQCHGSTGYCWCVDPMGNEIKGTQSRPGTTPTDCENPAPKNCSELASRPPIPGRYIPQCDEDGNYKPKQCHASIGYCWCVDPMGKEIEGTRSTPTDCENPAPKNCSELASRPPIPGRYIPQCDEDGNYKSTQCHGSTGHCWCVDHNGKELEGTRWQAGTTPTNCEKPDDNVPKCSEIKIDAITTDDSGKSYMFIKQTYTQLDGNRDTFYINTTWKEVNDGVDAVYSYADTITLIKNDQVYVYKKEASHYTLNQGYPKTLKEELNIEGHVDAAFVCNNEHIVNVIQGHRMHSVNLTASPRGIPKYLPLPLSDIDAARCDAHGVELYKGSEYYYYISTSILALSKIAPEPLPITSKQLKCQD